MWSWNRGGSRSLLPTESTDIQQSMSSAHPTSLERLVFEMVEMTCYVSTGTLNPTHSVLLINHSAYPEIIYSENSKMTLHLCQVCGKMWEDLMSSQLYILCYVALNCVFQQFLVVSTSAIDCLEMTCYVSSGTLNPTHSVTRVQRYNGLECLFAPDTRRFDRQVNWWIVFGFSSVGPSLRLYCDICDVYDVHDTEDCPQQEM